MPKDALLWSNTKKKKLQDVTLSTYINMDITDAYVTVFINLVAQFSYLLYIY